MMGLVKVAETQDVASGGATVVETGGKSLALFNLGGTFYAIDNTCTHAGCSLGEGTVEGTIVTCICHGSQFEITNGQVVRPPAQRPVASYRVSVDNNQVMVQLD